MEPAPSEGKSSFMPPYIGRTNKIPVFRIQEILARIRILGSVLQK
jgi:hypothetical protein